MEENKNKEQRQKKRLSYKEYKEKLIASGDYIVLHIPLYGPLKHSITQVHQYRMTKSKRATKAATIRLLLCMGLDVYKSKPQYQQWIQHQQEQAQAAADEQERKQEQEQAQELDGLFNII